VKLDPFIEAEEAAGHGVKRCCELFEVSRAAYYQRRNGGPSARELDDAELTEQIREVHADSNGTYGSPRVTKELRKRGVVVGRRRVRRLMRLAGLEGRAKKRWRRTTIPDPDFDRAKDLIQRAFGPCTEVDRRYVGDITYVATWEGWAYLATVIDLASRKVVGWALADHMRTELVIDALEMAFTTRRPPPGAIFHSELGRVRARCRPFGRSVSLTRPPNRTCDSHRIRLSVSSCRRTTRRCPSSAPTVPG
jgi:transposase InsO family protein